jgi:K+-transporting ATPase A subunit
MTGLTAGGLLLAVVALIAGAVTLSRRGTGGRRRTVIAAAAVLVLLGTTAVVWAWQSGQQVRLEVDTRSGTASEITWYTGQQHRLGGRISTPWAITTTAKGFGGLITVAAATARNDEITCRILIDGKTVAIDTNTFVAACSHA